MSIVLTIFQMHTQDQSPKYYLIINSNHLRNLIFFQNITTKFVPLLPDFHIKWVVKNIRTLCLAFHYCF